jgi:hypothetical protein
LNAPLTWEKADESAACAGGVFVARPAWALGWVYQSRVASSRATAGRTGAVTVVRLTQVLDAESRNQIRTRQGEHAKGYENDGNVNGSVRHQLTHRDPNHTDKEAKRSVNEV